jgi:hypothetical protein
MPATFIGTPGPSSGRPRQPTETCSRRRPAQREADVSTAVAMPVSRRPPASPPPADAGRVRQHRTHQNVRGLTRQVLAAPARSGIDRPAYAGVPAGPPDREPSARRPTPGVLRLFLAPQQVWACPHSTAEMVALARSVQSRDWVELPTLHGVSEVGQLRRPVPLEPLTRVLRVGRPI